MQVLYLDFTKNLIKKTIPRIQESELILGKSEADLLADNESFKF